MLTTNTARFDGGPRPTSFSIRSRSLLRPGRTDEFCSICSERSSRWARREWPTHAGRKYLVCGGCLKRYHDPVGQIESFGLRFRFLERAEVATVDLAGMTPSPVTTRPNLRQIYKILLLLKERQEIRQKEVNWVPNELAIRTLKLPDQIATIVSKTFAIRGDDFTLADDEALIRIRDLLESIDPKIIDRNKNKRLP